ncbi:MAG TPA: 30S ribosomal protein S6 [Candidatus Binatia bacterium]
MRSYESLIAYHPDLGEAAIKEQIERVKQIITGNGGEVTQAVEWGLRDLAYRIQKQRRAFYVIVTFKGTGATVSELERNLRISENVLRYMTTQVDPNRPPLELHKPRREATEGEREEGAEAGESGGAEQAAEGAAEAEAEGESPEVG